MAERSIVEETKGRFEGMFVIATVVLVLVAWGATLVYLAVRFL